LARPSKLTPDITKRIGENIVIGLPYDLVAEAPGITYQTFNLCYKQGKTEKSGKYYQFYNPIKKRNVDAAKTLLECLNSAAESGNCHVCMFILERRFPDEFGRRVYRKITSVSENKNENFELIVNDADDIREKVIEKFALVREDQEPLTI
jgi:hypothetical protein